MKHILPCSRLTVPIVAYFVTVCLGGQARAQASPDAVAVQLQQRYAALDGLRASFQQQLGDQSLQGTLMVRGDAFRLDLEGQTLVTNGETLWSYSQPDGQVVIQNYDPEEAGFSVGQLFTNYLKVFRATGATKATIDGVEHDVLTLVPREVGMSVQDVTLYVRSSDAIPTRVRVHDAGGRTLAFDLVDVQPNPELPPSTFRLALPDGVEIVDLR